MSHRANERTNEKKMPKMNEWRRKPKRTEQNAII